ncbi:MAG: hypothetical protein ACI8WB_004586 [Phenylobacterium sp.]|jgi:hypothetical protein
MVTNDIIMKSMGLSVLKKISFIVFMSVLMLALPLRLFAASIEEFTKGMEKNPGFYTFYYDSNEGKVFVELSQFEQPFLFQSSLPAGLGSNDLGLDRGQLGETRLVQFERFGQKVLLKQLNPFFKATSGNVSEQQSIEEAFASSVLAGFKVVANDKKTVLIDYSAYLMSDIHGVSRQLSGRKQGNFKLDHDRSVIYPKRNKAFPDNIELESMLTFAGSEPGNFVRQIAPDPYNLTVRMHHSFVRLPDDNYQTRTFSPFSGFWSIESKDYSAKLDESMAQRVIPRHRLIKKNPQAPMSEAVEPIVYYLDAGVPDPVRGALLDGARWWNAAFEEIGFKDAFQVKVLPADADPMDIRYNVIQWVHRATRGWSYGSSVIDPRTGEIIKGHVTLGSLRVRQDILIAQGLTAAFDGDPDKLKAAQEMALDRIRQLSAHEVGHTLGIAHNFAASTQDRASVMDYPQPLATLDDNGDVALTGAYAKGVDVWDKYVIAYGYSVFAGEGASDEDKQLAQLERQAKDKGYLFISDPDSRSANEAHPDANLWDNGKDPVEELNRMVKVRAKALSKFGLNSIKQGTPLSSLEERLVPLYLYHRYQAQAAAKLVGGLDYGYEVKTAGAAIGSTIVEASRQKAALNAILETISPDFLALEQDTLNLILPKAYGYSRDRESFKNRTGVTFDPVSIAEVAARHSVSLLLNPQRLNRVAQQSGQVRDGLTVKQLVNAIFKHSIKVSSESGLKLPIQQRVTSVVMELVMQAVQSDKVAPEVKAVLYDEVMRLSPWLSKKLKKKNGPNHGLYRLLKQQLTWFEQSGEWKSQFKLLPLPPGSPI